MRPMRAARSLPRQKNLQLACRGKALRKSLNSLECTGAAHDAAGKAFHSYGKNFRATRGHRQVGGPLRCCEPVRRCQRRSHRGGQDEQCDPFIQVRSGPFRLLPRGPVSTHGPSHPRPRGMSRRLRGRSLRQSLRCRAAACGRRSRRAQVHSALGRAGVRRADSRGDVCPAPPIRPVRRRRGGRRD